MLAIEMKRFVVGSTLWYPFKRDYIKEEGLN